MKTIGVAILGLMFLYQGGIAVNAAAPTDFVGTATVTAFGDFNISDPVAEPAVLEPVSANVSIMVSANAAHDLDLSVMSGSDQLATGLVVRPDGSAGLSTGDIAFPGAWSGLGSNLLDAIVVTHGNVLALGIIGQEASNRADTGFLFSAWQKTPTPVTRDDFIGTWVTGADYSSRNLRVEGFSVKPFEGGPFLIITAGSTENTILASVAGEIVELQVDGSRAFLPNPTVAFGANQLAIELVHGGDELVLFGVGQEFDDATDLSLGFIAVSRLTSSPATVSWSGQIDSVLVDDGSGVFAGKGVGDQASGSFGYGLDDSSALRIPDASGETDYVFTGPPFKSEIRIVPKASGDTTSFSTDSSIIIISNNNPIAVDRTDDQVDASLNALSEFAGFRINRGDPYDGWSAEGESGNLLFGIQLYAFRNLTYTRDEEFFPVPPATCDFASFLILETKSSGGFAYAALGKVDQLIFAPKPGRKPCVIFPLQVIIQLLLDE